MNCRRALDGLDEDIRDHIERETQENIEPGMTAEETRSAALRRFGNVAHVMEETGEVWRRLWIEQLLQDLRYGLRFLRRNPRFAAAVVLTLTLGIGVTTAVFSSQYGPAEASGVRESRAPGLAGRLRPSNPAGPRLVVGTVLS